MQAHRAMDLQSLGEHLWVSQASLVGAGVWKVAGYRRLDMVLMHLQKCGNLKTVHVDEYM